MKRIRLLPFLVLLGGLVSGCANLVTMHGVTNNPVGTKKGTVTVGFLSKDKDFSFNAAAKKGKINRIGSWEIKTGFLKVSTTVTGEQAGK